MSVDSWWQGAFWWLLKHQTPLQHLRAVRIFLAQYNAVVLIPTFVKHTRPLEVETLWLVSRLVLGALDRGFRLILPLIDDLEEAHIKGGRLLFDERYDF